MDDKIELALIKKLEAERDKSNLLYAPIIVKIIVFGMVGIILASALAKLLNLI